MAAVPNQEGKAERRWTVATVQEEAPQPTRPFGNTPTTHHRLTDMLERDHMSTKHGVSFLVQNAIWPCWPGVPHYF